MCICTNKESKEKKGTCKHTGSGAASTCSCNCDDCLDCRGSSCKKNCKPAAGNLSICKASQGNTLTVGQRDQVSARFNCGYSGNRHIGWRSSNPNVVKVDCYGNLTAVGEGYACIYAYVYGNSSVYDRITIHVTANGSSSGSGSSGSSGSGSSGSGSSGENMTIDLLDNEFRPLAETLSDGPWVMNTGEKYQFRYSIKNKAGTPEVSWSVSDNSTLHVNDNGEVTALRVGTSELTVKIVGADSDAQCSVMVEVIENSDNPIIFNTIHFDRIYGTDEKIDEYANSLPSNLVVRYYCGKINQFKIERNSSPADIWVKNEIYGTNASFFGGKKFSAVHVYDGVSFQPPYEEKGRENDEDEKIFRNGDEPRRNAFGLLLFEKDGTPHIFTNQFSPPCLNGSEEHMKVADMQFAIGGIDLFGDQSLEKKDFQDCFKDAYDGYEGAFDSTTKRHRTVIGYDSQTDRIVLAILYRDRRGDFDAGNPKKFSDDKHLYDQVSFFQAHLVMKYLHCDMILNIDGGRSTQMSFRESGIEDYLINVNDNVLACVRVKNEENDKIVWSE